MLKLVKECAPWLNWKTAGIIALAMAAIIVCTGLPSLGVLAGVAPVLLLIACLVPCLAPLLLLRKKGGKAQTLDTIRLNQQGGQGASTCGCGQEGCQSKKATEAARA